MKEISIVSSFKCRPSTVILFISSFSFCKRKKREWDEKWPVAEHLLKEVSCHLLTACSFPLCPSCSLFFLLMMGIMLERNGSGPQEVFLFHFLLESWSKISRWPCDSKDRKWRKTFNSPDPITVEHNLHLLLSSSTDAWSSVWKGRRKCKRM